MNMENRIVVRIKKAAYNPFKDLKKVKDGEFTDGLGNEYDAPIDGCSEEYAVKAHKFRYNFKTKELELLNNNEVAYSLELSLGNWLDNPEYWAEKLLEEMEYE